MKRSNLFLGASAFILAVAGAFTTKASNAGHQKVVATRGSHGTSCIVHANTNGLTKVKITAQTFITNGRTAFTSTNCAVTLFKIAD